MFTPTPHMKVWLETAMRMPTANISQIADECQISRASWYQWQSVEGFRDWFNSQWSKGLNSYSQQLDAVGLRRALEGDFRFWQAMQEKIGIYANNGSDSILSDEQLDTKIDQLLRQLKYI